MYECSVKSTFFLPRAISVLISHFAVVILWLFLVHFDVCARSSENYAVCKMIYCIVVVRLFIFIMKRLWWIIKIFFSFFFIGYAGIVKYLFNLPKLIYLKCTFFWIFFSSIRRRDFFVGWTYFHFQLEYLVKTLYLQKLLVPEGMLVINFSCLLCAFTFSLVFLF